MYVDLNRDEVSSGRKELRFTAVDQSESSIGEHDRRVESLLSSNLGKVCGVSATIVQCELRHILAYGSEPLCLFRVSGA